MKCPNCQQEVETTAVFCGNCGQRLQAPTPPEPVAIVQPSLAPQAPAMNVPAPVAPQPQPVQAQAFMPPLAPQPVPGYAMAQSKKAEGSGLLTLAVVLAVISVRTSLVPIVGLVCSITAIVLASKHHAAGTGRMVTSIVIGSIGLLLSLAAWGYNISQNVKHTGLAPTTTVTTTIYTVHSGSNVYRTLFAANQ